MIEWLPYIKNGGAVYVDVFFEGHRLRLAGYDNYWIDGYTVGMYNDEHNREEYGFACSYTWEGDRFVRGDILPKENVEVLEGVWLPDDEYRQVMRR